MMSYASYAVTNGNPWNPWNSSIHPPGSNWNPAMVPRYLGRQVGSGGIRTSMDLWAQAPPILYVQCKPEYVICVHRLLPFSVFRLPSSVFQHFISFTYHPVIAGRISIKFAICHFLHPSLPLPYSSSNLAIWQSDYSLFLLLLDLHLLEHFKNLRLRRRRRRRRRRRL